MSIIFAIHEYIIKSWSLVKIGTTAAQRKLFFNLRKLRNSIANSGECNTEEDIDFAVSKKLDVGVKDVKNMNAHLQDLLPLKATQKNT